ncbi:MAG: LysM peptidoglycan-binding domain-containing protein [Clostridia bacterium]|nr:LysM peptidoglycan-binding domain-containing protein [Clostridia bacterium]
MENQGRICPRGASYYTWQPGDTLRSVSQQAGTTVQAMQLINPDVDFSAIAIGTEICLPSQSFTCVSGMAYSVRAGETFTSIAEDFGISTYELAERNPGVDQNNLMVGQVLCVPFMTGGGNSGGNSNGGSNGGNRPAEPTTPSLPTPSLPSAPAQPSTPPIVIVPSTPPASACPSGYTRDIVRAGQTYTDLLLRHNVSYRAMRSANPRLSPGYLVVGQSYCAPPAGTRQICQNLKSYTILPGEDLETLAADLRTTKGRLLALNPTLLPSDFSSGTVICIP